MQMGFQRNETRTYTKRKFFEKNKINKRQKFEMGIQEYHWVLPQGLDCPVSPLEFEVRSLLPSFKLCVFLFKIFNV